MSQFKDNIVVLKSTNLGEADKIITVFGENFGKYAVVAKGIRKLESKNRGNLQTMSVAKVSFYRRTNLGVLTESELLAYPEITPDTMKNIQRVLVLVSKVIPEDQPDKEIYAKLVGVVNDNFDLATVNRFRLFFLKQMGYLEYALCAECGESGVELIKFDPKTFEFFLPRVCKKKGKEPFGC